MSILCYHTVDPAWDSRLAISPERFERHCRWLRRNRDVVDLDTAIRLMDTRGRLPPGVAALTFDDGFAGLHTHALPVLRSLALPATVFVVARTLSARPRPVDWIDGPTPGPLDTLTLDQLRELLDAGIEIGSHSLDHRVLTELEPDECERDLRTSRALLEDLLGRPVPFLAYPRGRHDESVQGAARRAGHSHALALPERREPVDRYAIPRVGVYAQNDVATLRTKSQPRYLGIKTHRVFPLAQRLVRAARPARRKPRVPARASAPTHAPPRTPDGSGDRPLTVAYVMSRFPKLSETFILDEMLALARRGVDVRIHPLLRERARRTHPGVRELLPSVTYQPFVSGPILRSNLRTLTRDPRRYLSTFAEVLRGTWGSANFTVGAIGIWPKVVHTARLLDAAGVDHVHCHFATHPALAGLIVHRLTGIPFSFTAHGSDLHVERRMLDRKVDAAAFVIAISEYNRELLLADGGAGAAAKVHVLHCGVDTDTFRPAPPRKPDDAFRVLCIGTLHEVKGQRVLIAATSTLRQLGIPVRVELVGEGPDRRLLERQIRSSGLQGTVQLLGGLTRDEVLERLRTSDMLVAPSVPTGTGKREGIPVVLMEAMACGLPVVASELSGIPELVRDGETGLLVTPGDADELAHAIALLFRSEGLARDLGTVAREMVEREFSLDRNTASLVDLFTTTTARRAPGGTP